MNGNSIPEETDYLIILVETLPPLIMLSNFLYLLAQKVGSVLLPNVGGFIIGRLVNYDPYKSEWSNNLKRPVWAPPKWAYAPIWATLYSGIGYASYIVWRDGGGFEGAKLPLTLYGIQLALNWSWMPLVFKYESLKAGLLNFSLSMPMASVCIYEFYKVSHTAGFLMAPYFLYMGFATFLNYTLYELNEKPKSSIK